MRPAYVWELRKLRAQRRTLFGLIAAAAIPLTFAIGLAIKPTTTTSGGRQEAGDYLSIAYNSSGLVLPFVALVFSSLILLPLLAALVAGDIVAAEDNHHTLKTVLTRSVGRRQLLVAKMLATTTYVVVLLVVFFLSGLVIGAIAQGVHPIRIGGVPLAGGFSFQVPPIPVGSSLLRLLLALAFYLPALLSVSAWGFLISTTSRNSGASIVGMLVFSFANQIIGFLPGIPESVTRWLLSDQFTAWQATLGTTISYAPLFHALLVSVIYAVPPLLLSLWSFQRRDVLV